MFQKTRVSKALLLAFGGALAVVSVPTFAQTTAPAAEPERIEVTGSRIKRADSEGALPVTVFTRETLESSGATTVAEFVRNITYASAGNFRPQSGSSAQSFASLDLRGLGAARTLILLDGRRLPKAPNVGDSVDMNSVPLAAVERIEILQDGASAVYGSDAIGGVVNIITRKDFEGIAASFGVSRPSTGGGDRQEASAVIGMNGEKGRMVAGISRTSRDIVFTSQRPWGQELGVSSYGNNYFGPDGLTAIPGGCTEPNFYLTAGGTCSFNFNAVAADEAAITSTSIFARGEVKIAKDWTGYLNTSVSRVESFGRYAPSLAQLNVTAGSPNDFLGTGDDITIRHRFAALGNRDTSTDATLYDMMLGAQGRVMDKFDLDFGVRWTESKYAEFGRNYVVIPIAEQFVADGTYDIFNPSTNAEDVLNAMKATISRDGTFRQTEAFASATMDLFSMGGGTSSLLVALETRKEVFGDIYDSLSEAGVIGGSAGNTSSGDRKVGAVAAEWLLPVAKGLEVDLAARFEKYSDYGSDFSPKASVAWKPISGLSLRGSVGTGFRAPSLNILNAKTTFSAESVFDVPTCVAFGGTPEFCADNSVQVDTFIQANPLLKSEQSKQFSFGGTWDVLPSVSVKADYYNITIDDTISQVSAADILAREAGTDPTPIPPGLGVIRGAQGEITRVNAGYANEGTLKTSGIDLNALINYKLGGFGGLRHDVNYTRVLKYTVAGNDLEGTIGLPKSRATIGTTWDISDFAFTWNLNYIGTNGSESTEDRVGSYVTHDLQANWDTPIKGGKLTLGLINAGDKAPSLVDYDGRNFNFYLYDSYGRTAYVRYSQKF